MLGSPRPRCGAPSGIPGELVDAAASIGNKVWGEKALPVNKTQPPGHATGRETLNRLDTLLGWTAWETAPLPRGLGESQKWANLQPSPGGRMEVWPAMLSVEGPIGTALVRLVETASAGVPFAAPSTVLHCSSLEELWESEINSF